MAGRMAVISGRERKRERRKEGKKKKKKEERKKNSKGKGDTLAKKRNGKRFDINLQMRYVHGIERNAFSIGNPLRPV